MTGIGDFLTDSENMVEFGSRLRSRRSSVYVCSNLMALIVFGIQNSVKYNGTFERW